MGVLLIPAKSKEKGAFIHELTEKTQSFRLQGIKILFPIFFSADDKYLAGDAVECKPFQEYTREDFLGMATSHE